MVAEPVITFVGDDDTGFFGLDGGIWEILRWAMRCQMDFQHGRVERGRTAGFPREHLVIAWKSVDFPTLARPTCSGVKVSEKPPYRYFMHRQQSMHDTGVKEETHNSTLQIIPGPPEHNLLLLGSLLRRHLSDFRVRSCEEQ